MTARQFVRHGPAIPAEVLRALDEDRLVLFCGAGISMGTGLPGFRDLVSDVYKACHTSLETAALVAFDREEYDKALDILENAEGENRGSMRRAVMRRLLQAPEGDTGLSLHRALLSLAERKGRPGERGGHRLVTTNFDDRFELTGRLPPAEIEQGPAVRRPRPNTLRKVTYLHGRIERELPEPERELSDLVLTSADFGSAYLHDGWAARFVVELFREFTVLFVGYGLNDPVMRYLVDAFASEKRSGGRFEMPFALASYKS
jgi:hypothetical protein